jgi:molybdate transport system ATP-binding protein
LSAGVSAELELTLGAFRLELALEAPSQGVTVVIGESGSGKTTLLRCLAGLEPAVRGRVAVGGEIWLDSERGTVLPPHRRRVGFVFQDASLFPHLSVRRNLEYGLRRTPRADRSVGLEEAVSWLGVGPLLERRTERLSGGERQRVAIARVLLSSPRLLLLDEPLASLDPVARVEILGLLRALFQRTRVPVLYVTHARSEAVQLADHVVLLDRGGIRAEGPLRDVSLRADAVPFGRPDELGAVLHARVSAVDEADDLSTLEFVGGSISVSGRLQPGETRRLEILARDVSLALERPSRTSILNVLSGRVVEVREPGSPQPVVVVDIGGERLLARISRRSLRQLGLEQGVQVFAQIKAVAVTA